MNSESEMTRPSVLTWRDEMHAQLERGKHILLYGNVEDRYLLNETRPRTVLLAQCLNHYFLSQKYQLVIHYDLADGMRTAIPELMDPLLLSLLDGANGNPDSESAASFGPSRGTSGGTSEGASGGTSGGNSASAGTPSSSGANSVSAPSSISGLNSLSNSGSNALPASNSASGTGTVPLPGGFPSVIRPSTPEARAGSPLVSQRAEQIASEFELASQQRRNSSLSALFTRRTQANSPSAPSGTQTAPSGESTGNSEESAPPSLSVRSRSAEDAIPQLRQVLAQDQISTVVVVHFSDKLFDDTRRQNRAEREYLLHLKKILIEASTIRQGSLAGRRNSLVLVASKLSAVPTWLYQEHPLLALIRIPNPVDEERRQFIQSFLNVFTRNAPLTETQRAEYVQTFVDQTQGLALWDLMALGAMANRSTDDAIDEPREIRHLISLYRYGQKEDPWDKFNSGDRRDRIQAARESIEKRVKGQPEAVNAIVEMLISATVGVTMSPSTRQTGKPKGVFFFVGPTGVGKTELAKALAELIFGDESRLRRFDMSEYSESHAAEKLTGSPPGYVGYEEGGQLTNFVRENPFSLLLFDEIEKAHGQVMDKFLQILEDGRLTDSKGQTAFFSQSVIIFTSNIGADSLFTEMDGTGEMRVSDESPDYETCIQKHFQEKVRDHFVHVLKRPEILNRFGDNVIVFDVLRPGFVRSIGEKFLGMLKISAKERRGLILEFEPSILEAVQNAMQIPQNIKNGGRRIRTLLEDRLEKKLNRWIFEHQPEKGTILILGFDQDGTLQVQTP